MNARKRAYQIYILLIIALANLYFIENVYTQTKQVKFTQINGKSGISLGKINAITQDEYGFLWLSDQTNRCIIRYDGSNMVRFAYDVEDPNSLGGYYPECLYADHDGILWIGFFGQGLDRFDTKTNTFTHFQNIPGDPNSLPDDMVTCILRDHLGNLWIGHFGGVSILDESTGKFTNYSHDPTDPNSLSFNRVRSLYEDKDGTIWVGSGFAFGLDVEGGLNRFNREEGNFKRFLHDPENPNSLVANPVRSIFEDSRGTFWVGSSEDGLHSFNRGTEKFTNYPYNARRPNQLSRPPLASLFNNISFIEEDNEGHIWIGTGDNGISRYNPEAGSVKRYGSRFGAYPGFPDNSGWTMFKSRDGLLWLATQESNLYQIDIKNYFIPKESLVLSGGSTSEAGLTGRAFVQDTKDILWIGTQIGLFRKDLKTNKFRVFRHDPNDPNSISNDYINALFIDSKGELWVSTENGLNLYNRLDETFKVYKNDPNNSNSLSWNDVGEIVEDEDGHLWISTYGMGMVKWDRKSNIFTRYIHNPTDLSSVNGDMIVALAKDVDGRTVTGGARNDGIGIYDPNSSTFQRFLGGISILDLYLDKRGTLWAGTNIGLFYQGKESREFLPVSEISPQLHIDAVINSIVEDNNQNLWLGSSQGICRIDSARILLTQFGLSSGIRLDEVSGLRGAYLGVDGKIYLSSTFEGYYVFTPDIISFPKGSIPLYFTNFWIDGRIQQFGQNEKIKDPVMDLESISLSYSDRDFGISFTAVDFNSDKNKFIDYKLDNYDPQWRRAKSEEQINYYRVPPGNYTFHIKAPNSANGVWSEKSLNVIIAKPWWQQWWAYILYLVILLTGVRLVHNYQKKRVLRAERERSRQKELEQAREIEKAYADLKATQDQLIHSEKMASLGELTAGIAHEIKNPLNFVNNFAEVSSEMIAEMKDELMSGNQEEAEDIADSLTQNLEKIVHHGQRADNIVKSMLQHSRATEGEKQLTNINELADEYLRLAYHGLRAKDKTFNAKMVTDLDETLKEVMAIPQDIGRVVLNLITNAFYTVIEKQQDQENGYEPQVSVSTRQYKNRVEIRVKDNGKGISQSALEKIFQPFFTTKPTGEGTGLGLSLSYDIVKAHGGQLSVKTEEGKGSEFIIELPIA